MTYLGQGSNCGVNPPLFLPAGILKRGTKFSSPCRKNIINTPSRRAQNGEDKGACG